MRRKSRQIWLHRVWTKMAWKDQRGNENHRITSFTPTSTAASVDKETKLLLLLLLLLWTKFEPHHANQLTQTHTHTHAYMDTHAHITRIHRRCYQSTSRNLPKGRLRRSDEKVKVHHHLHVESWLGVERSSNNNNSRRKSSRKKRSSSWRRQWVTWWRLLLNRWMNIHCWRPHHYLIAVVVITWHLILTSMITWHLIMIMENGCHVMTTLRHVINCSSNIMCLQWRRSDIYLVKWVSLIYHSLNIGVFIRSQICFL